MDDDDEEHEDEVEEDGEGEEEDEDEEEEEEEELCETEPGAVAGILELAMDSAPGEVQVEVVVEPEIL